MVLFTRLVCDMVMCVLLLFFRSIFLAGSHDGYAGCNGREPSSHICHVLDCQTMLRIGMLPAREDCSQTKMGPWTNLHP